MRNLGLSIVVVILLLAGCSDESGSEVESGESPSMESNSAQPSVTEPSSEIASEVPAPSGTLDEAELMEKTKDVLRNMIATLQSIRNGDAQVEQVAGKLVELNAEMDRLDSEASKLDPARLEALMKEQVVLGELLDSLGGVMSALEEENPELVEQIEDVMYGGE